MQRSAVSPDFSFDVQPDRERVIVRVAGELDIATAPHVEETVEDLLAVGFTRIVVDLRELSFLDSAAVHTLVSARSSAERHDCELSLIRGPQNVHRLFELTATDSLFGFDGGGLHR